MTFTDYPPASPKVSEFKAELDRAGFDYQRLTSVPAGKVNVSFAGPFAGQLVRWEMTLVTLNYLRMRDVLPEHHSGENRYPCPFIEISPGLMGVYPLTVALDLAEIDEPVIKKSIIMIRNYKRLVIGRLEFCANLET